MKKFAIVISLLSILIFLPLFVYSQSPCSGSFTEYYLNSNNIRASFFPRGNKFTDGQRPGFLVPYPSQQKLSTIFASSPWIGGFDDAGNLKLAAETFPTNSFLDYSVGPLTYIGTPFDSVCSYFDKAWSVYSEDIVAHIYDYWTDFKIDDTIPAIFGWPGLGNKYFEKYNGFQLPDVGNSGLAPYFDSNGNDKYDPDQGDYPIVQFMGKQYIPDQILWMVFNDLDSDVPTGNRPLRMEIQLTAFAFHCQDKEFLNNTIFNSYKIINRAVLPLDSAFFGLWTDYDLGCSEDDFVGCDSARSTEFVYNADAIDGNADNVCSDFSAAYKNIPPVQSMTYLSQPMHSFISYRNDNSNPVERYRLLTGTWDDGRPIRPEGDGYNASTNLSPTKFLFSGDPRDSASWAANHLMSGGTDVKTVSSVSLGRIDPGQIKIVETAYTYHYAPQADLLGQITMMYNDIDSLLAIDYYPDSICTAFPICLDHDCVWPGDFNHNGISDQFDLLNWGVMKDADGSPRNGLVSWRGHYADDWSSSLPEGLNFKHGDGNGDGMVNSDDLGSNTDHFLYINNQYNPVNLYPVGPEIILTAQPMDSSGSVKSFSIRTGTKIENVIGLAYELEYDTSIFRYNSLITSWPGDSDFLLYTSLAYGQVSNFLSHSFRYAGVQTDHTGIVIPANVNFQRTLTSGFYLKPGLTLADVPDSSIFRLRNLIAIDPEGNDLHIGSEPLVVYKEGFTGISDPEKDDIIIYPNPTRDLLYVEVPNDVLGELLNVQGQLLKQIHLSSKSPIDVSGLNPGIYLLRMHGSSHIYKIVIY